MISFDPTTASFRGPATEIADLAEALAGPDELSAVLAARAPGITEDAALPSLRDALASPLFEIGLTVSGPGAQHVHRIVVGANGVGVRRSPLREGDAELAAFPIGTLHGGITRLVRFLPGLAPTAEQGPIPVPAEQLLQLTSPEASVRTGAWSVLEPLLAASLGDPADDSWQIVEARSSWTTPSGERSEDLSVQIRRAEHHLLVADAENGGGSASLRPVTSLRAWEDLMRVLPAHDEVGTPA